MKKYTFFAKTNPKFMSSLISEIQAIAGLEKINSLKHKRLNLIKFEAPMDKVWRILLYSRLAEDVKIQIKENLNIK
jgi:hypothetical protein